MCCVQKPAPVSETQTRTLSKSTSRRKRQSSKHSRATSTPLLLQHTAVCVLQLSGRLQVSWACQLSTPPSVCIVHEPPQCSPKQTTRVAPHATLAYTTCYDPILHKSTNCLKLALPRLFHPQNAHTLQSHQREPKAVTTVTLLKSIYAVQPPAKPMPPLQ